MELQLPTTPFTFRDAIRADLPRGVLETALKGGHLYRVSRGVYARPVTVEGTAETWERHRKEHLHRLRAALHRFPGAVASHTSAAVVHGLELVIAAGASIDLTVVEGVPQSRLLEGVTIHHTDSTTTAHVVVDGIRTTTVPRTVADVLRTRKAPHSVAMTDRALAAGVVTLPQVTAELDRQVRWRGRPRACEALEFVDPRRESWLESFSFVTLHEQGHPVPLPQISLHDGSFNFIGRVDGLWPRDKAFAEADGREKYFLGADGQASPEPEEAARRRLEQERTRHARLEALGLAGVRWTGREVMADPEVVSIRAERARERGRGMEFRGWVRQGEAFVRLEALYEAA